MCVSQPFWPILYVFVFTECTPTPRPPPLLAEIVENVVEGGNGEPYRPDLDNPEGDTEHATEPVIKIMTSCWSEEPEKRPGLSDIKKKLRALNKGK